MRAMLDDLTRDRLLRRIGLSSVPAADADGLRTAHRAYVSHVPFEDITVQLGESAVLEPGALVERVLTDGRGGYCFEVNTVLLELLTTLGFSVERRLAIVGPRSAHADGQPINHMALVVTTPAGEEFVAEGGWGEGPLDPVPLREGPVQVGPNVARLERDGDGWWFSQHEFGTTPGYRFGDAPVTLDDFQQPHVRTSTSPDSMFVQTLVVQQPYDDRVVTLRGRTTFVDGRGVRERAVLDSADELGAALKSLFGITITGERLARLWAAAVAQHDAHSS
jgi:N-hydroxyarylamine O-acetyltransferase